jgi:hypothetical protein
MASPTANHTTTAPGAGHPTPGPAAAQPATAQPSGPGSRIRIVERHGRSVVEVQRPCDECGSVMLPARRFEAARTVPVLCCWDCGHEEPPYRTSERTISPTTRKACAWCGEAFTVDGHMPPIEQRTCSMTCADNLAAFTASGRRRVRP